VVDTSVYPRVLRMKWEADSTRTLLLLRGREMRTAFSGEQGPARLKALWESLHDRFEHAHGVSVDVSQLNNKFNALRREHAAVVEQRQRATVGEQDEEIVELPPYWDAMELAFGSEARGEAEAGAVAHHQPSSRTQRRQSRPSGGDEAGGAADREQDAVDRLEELLRRQAERQEAMRALLERQAGEFDVMTNETAAVNREVLAFIRNVGRRRNNNSTS
jgi:hypothetical protein